MNKHIFKLIFLITFVGRLVLAAPFGYSIDQAGLSAQNDGSSISADQATVSVPDKNGLYRVNKNIAPPKLLSSVKPTIAKGDRKHIKFGKTTTIIQLTVAADGTVQNPHVISSSMETMKSKDVEASAIIDQSCLEAVKQYHFEPATLNKKPVPVLISVQVDFRIF
jgi:hypothetical protein